MSNSHHFAICERLKLHNHNDTRYERLHYAVPIYGVVVLHNHAVLHCRATIDSIPLHGGHRNSMQHRYNDWSLDQCVVMHGIEHAKLSVHKLDCMEQHQFVYGGSSIHQPQLHC